MQLVLKYIADNFDIAVSALFLRDSWEPSY